jgi:protein PhnA
MAADDDEYMYDEATGEWRPASEIAAQAEGASEVRDASGTLLVDGDSVTLIKDLKVKGATIPKKSTAVTMPSRASCCVPNSCANAETTPWQR